MIALTYNQVTSMESPNNPVTSTYTGLVLDVPGRVKTGERTGARSCLVPTAFVAKAGLSVGLIDNSEVLAW